MIATEVDRHCGVNVPAASGQSTNAAPTKPSQERDDSDPQELTVRSSVGFNEWVASIAEDYRCTVADVVEVALVELGKKCAGVGDPPPRLPRRNRRLQDH